MSKHKPIILVTGAKGQLGKTLQKISLSESAFEWVFCDKETLDICQPQAIEATFAQYVPDYCINTAAFTNVNLAEENPYLAKAVNVTAVDHLVAACNQHKSCLLQLSTDYVFDGAKRQPYVESDATHPLNVYGKSKAEGEQIVLKDAQKGYVIRTAWLYAKSHGHNFYRSILKKAIAGEGLSVVNDQVGSPTTTEQLALFLMQIVKKVPPYGLYHCAGEEVISWHAFAKKILQDHQLDVPLEATITPNGGIKRPRFSALATEKRIK
jgi:dTDP-4-dehydrorhamnose reductase